MKALALLLLFAGCGKPQPAALTEHTLPGQGELGQYLLYRPAGWRGPGKVLLALHHAGGNPREFLRMTGLLSLADRHRMAVVLPYGPPRVIHGVETSWDARTPLGENRDIAFIESALAAAGQSLGGIAALYALGYSQGGFLAYHWGTAQPERFAGLAIHAAADPHPEIAPKPGRVRIHLVVGALDFPIDSAREAAPRLRSLGYDVRFDELPNHMHDLVPAMVGASLDFMLGERAKK